MIKPNIKVVVFDIDGTLTSEVSWLKLTESLGADTTLHKQIFDDFKNKKMSYLEAKSQLVSLWLSTKKSNKQTLTNIFNSWNLKSDAEKLVEYLKTKYTIILISGSVDLYVETVAKKLNIENWYANTTLVWNKNNEISDFHYEANQAQKKFEQLSEFLDESGLKKEDCLIIGNGDSDLVLFQELPYGITINKEPYPELEKLAWKKVTNLSEIKELL